MVGGKISKTNAINIATPSGTIGIRGGITIFSVTPGSTTANFIFGHSMTVTGQGQTQSVTRQGSQVIVNSGASPSLPHLVPPGSLNVAIKQLETGTMGGGSAGNIHQKAQTSGFSGTNSGPPPPTTNPPNVNSNYLTTPITNSGGGSNPQNNTTDAAKNLTPTTTNNPTLAATNNSMLPPPPNICPPAWDMHHGFGGGWRNPGGDRGSPGRLPGRPSEGNSR